MKQYAKGGDGMSGYDFSIHTKEDMIHVIETYGFLPFFAGTIPGFSLEEHVTRDLWYTSGGGSWKAWEWKGPVIQQCGCAYGKFLENKAVFISREWFLDFANYRRNGYDFDARYEDGLASYRDRELYELLDQNAPILSKGLKARGNYGKGGKSGFDTIITRLQAQCYVLIEDFVYETNQLGYSYGWGIAKYSTPEKFMKDDFTKNVYQRTPEESYSRIFQHLKRLFPDTNETLIRKILK